MELQTFGLSGYVVHGGGLDESKPPRGGGEPEPLHQPARKALLKFWWSHEAAGLEEQRKKKRRDNIKTKGCFDVVGEGGRSKTGTLILLTAADWEMRVDLKPCRR